MQGRFCNSVDRAARKKRLKARAWNRRVAPRSRGASRERWLRLHEMGDSAAATDDIKRHGCQTCEAQRTGCRRRLSSAVGWDSHQLHVAHVTYWLSTSMAASIWPRQIG